MRMVQSVVALVLGQATAWRIIRLFPEGHGREASAFAPLFLILGIGFGIAVAYYALFEALRRARLPRANALPRAVARTRDQRVET